MAGDIAVGGTHFVTSDQTNNWLWRQAGPGEPTAWWINFGTFAQTNSNPAFSLDASFVGFQGIGTLGGGNLTVIAGGNAGLGVAGSNTSGLDLVVASTGRVLADGTIVQTGGGNLTLNIGGALNAIPFNSLPLDQFGSITDLRGDINVRAGSIGTISTINGTSDPADPRGVALQTIEKTFSAGGPTVTPGDGTVQISTRGNLVLSGAADAGMANILDVNGGPELNPDGTAIVAPGGWGAWFSLWTPSTSVALFSAGGDVVPQETISAQSAQTGFYPGTLSIVAATGSIRFVGSGNILELAPSPQGQLEVLAGTSIFGMGGIIAMSGADMSMLATPRNPAFGTVSSLDGGNISHNSPLFGIGGSDPIAFGADTPTSNLHQGDNLPALIYAGADIVDLQIGDIQTYSAFGSFTPAPTTWYLGAKPFQIIAGRDIVGTGDDLELYPERQYDGRLGNPRRPRHHL